MIIYHKTPSLCNVLVLSLLWIIIFLHNLPETSSLRTRQNNLTLDPPLALCLREALVAFSLSLLPSVVTISFIYTLRFSERFLMPH